MDYCYLIKQFVSNNKRSIFSFLTVGLLSAFFYLGLFALFWKGLGINYSISVSIAYLSTILFYFLANRRFTFQSNNRIKSQFFKFIFMVIFSYIFTLGIVQLVVEFLNLSPFLGIVVAIGTTTILNYLIAHFWVFKIKLKS